MKQTLRSSRTSFMTGSKRIQATFSQATFADDLHHTVARPLRDLSRTGGRRQANPAYRVEMGGPKHGISGRAICNLACNYCRLHTACLMAVCCCSKQSGFSSLFIHAAHKVSLSLFPFSDRGSRHAMVNEISIGEKVLHNANGRGFKYTEPVAFLLEFRMVPCFNVQRGSYTRLPGRKGT